MTELKPPDQWTDPVGPCVFLAGSIEQGRASEWQRGVVGALAHLPGTVYNPRRDAWDPDLRMSPDEPAFREQVEWELRRLRPRGRDRVGSDAVFFYFEPGTRSPISLLELGLCLGRSYWDKQQQQQQQQQQLFVCCPRSYERYGNVRITMEEHGATQHLYEDLGEATIRLVRHLTH